MPRPRTPLSHCSPREFKNWRPLSVTTFWLTATLCQAMLVEQVAERTVADAEELAGPGAVARRLLERLPDHGQLDVFQVPVEAEARSQLRPRGSRGSGTERIGKPLDQDRLRRLQGDRPLHHVLELSHVPGPGVL